MTMSCDAHALCDAQAACTTTCGQDLSSRLAAWVRRIAQAQRARAELSTMTDVELRDIGLSRGEIGAVANGQYRR
jgi:uncharacterized protein YjiS (DUF1127 family)